MSTPKSPYTSQAAMVRASLVACPPKASPAPYVSAMGRA